LKQALNDLAKKRQVLMSERGLAAKATNKGDTHLDKEKLEQLLVQIAEKEKSLNESYAAADTPEKKAKIKQSLEMLDKKRLVVLSESGMTLKNEAPSKAELEMKLQKVREVKLKLEQLIAQEKDQEKLKKLKMKSEDIAKFAEDLQIKIDKSSE
jgi:hypothetical protein